VQPALETDTAQCLPGKSQEGIVVFAHRNVRISLKLLIVYAGSPWCDEIFRGKHGASSITELGPEVNLMV